MLAYRDGAEPVAAVHAFGLGASCPGEELVEALTAGGFGAELAHAGAQTLLHFVFGHTADEQTHLQAESAGAVDDRSRRLSDFRVGLGLIVAGIRSRSPEADRPFESMAPAPR